MSIRWLEHCTTELENKLVFCRADLNVPLNEEGNITDESRILAALPTLKYLLEHKARVIVASHLGRPKGKVRKNLSLLPVAQNLQRHLNQEITFFNEYTIEGFGYLTKKMKGKELIVLENLRFHSGEEKNSLAFAKILAQGVDIYVGDGFGVMHRDHASVTSVPSLIPTKLGGFLLKKELANLNPLRMHPKRPFSLVLGGKKAQDKIGMMLRLMHLTDKIIVGGFLANSFLAALGNRNFEEYAAKEDILKARGVLNKAKEFKIPIILPVDHETVTEFSSEKIPLKVANKAINSSHIPIDIGPQTREIFKRELLAQETIFWNGPMGIAEWDSAFQGTKAIIEALAQSKAYRVAGGGDTLFALNKAAMPHAVDFVSTGGGASLQYLQGQSLPGLEALES